MFRSILVCLEENEENNRSIITAVNRICDPSTKVTLLTVTVAAPISDALQDEVNQLNRPGAQILLESAANNVKLEPENIRTQIVSGKPVQTIIGVAERLNPDLIVVGSSQKSGFDRFIEGSVSQEIVGESRQSVLVVKSPAASKNT